MTKHQHSKDAALVPVRMLSDWEDYKSGQFAELAAELARQLIDHGLADGNPHAVAYARKQDG